MSVKRPRVNESPSVPSPTRKSSPSSPSSTLLNALNTFIQVETSTPTLPPHVLLLLLNTCVEVLGTLQSSLPAHPFQIITDAIEEDKRLRSVMIERLPEHPNQSSLPSEQLLHDAKLVEGLMDDCDLSVAGIVHFRMGARRPNSPSASNARMLKVMFPGKFLQKQFLSRCASLRNSAPLKGIFVRPSLTREQREAEFLLRQEKRRLVAQGKDVVIYNNQIMSRADADAKRRSGTQRRATGPNAIPLSSPRFNQHGSLPKSVSRSPKNSSGHSPLKSPLN